MPLVKPLMFALIVWVIVQVHPGAGIMLLLAAVVLIRLIVKADHNETDKRKRDGKRSIDM
jgi:hypothetical protein